MARRRRATTRRTRRASRSSGVGSKLNIQDNLFSMGYGAVRQQISRLNPLRGMLGGLGTYADEVAMFVGLQGVKMFIKNKEVRKLANIGQNFESAIVGYQLSKNLPLLSGQSNSVESSPHTYG